MFRVVRPSPKIVRTLCWCLVALLFAGGLLHVLHVSADQLPTRSLTLSKALPSATDTYSLAFTIPGAETLGSIELQICSEGPLPGTPCTGPAGLDMSSAVLSSQAGATGFRIVSANANSVTLGRSAAAVSANTNVSFELQQIIDPSAPGSYFGRITTYVSSDGSGNSTDDGGLAFAIANAVQVSATVPPYLYFCVGVTVSGTDCTTASGDYINFGEFSTAVASVADSQMVAATNADTGYTIEVSGTTLTSGNNTIPELDNPDVSRPGTSQFGINLVANTDPAIGQNPSGSGVGQPTSNYAQANLYKFTSGDTVVSVPQPDDARTYTVSYLSNIAKSQAAGVYVSTLTYLCTGGF